ncbi:MAG: DNA gyrase inhibitor YacG [Phycisphaerales bacterium]|nr:DNA gyrase inhibitor YacG [Phycisphaerales bacterium]
MPQYRCAICEKLLEYQGDLPEVYPFCSARCKMVDLGRWFSESYSIDRDLTPEDLGATPEE